MFGFWISSFWNACLFLPCTLSSSSCLDDVHASGDQNVCSTVESRCLWNVGSALATNIRTQFAFRAGIAWHCLQLRVQVEKQSMHGTCIKYFGCARTRACCGAQAEVAAASLKCLESLMHATFRTVPLAAPARLGLNCCYPATWKWAFA